jgi:peptidoglycan/LPS O-acetylase OafA/YrhL
MSARTFEGVSASIVGLDILRGLAAILVVLGHSRSMLGDALGVGLTDAAWQKVLLLPTSFAQESVSVFFVLSGYLVGGQVMREVSAGRFSWRIYLAKRLSRLWTVLIPGLVLTLVVGILGGYTGAAWGKLARHGSLDPLSAVCNAAFLQEPRCSTYGSNDSLWSLAFEFWFYLIFAAATVAVVSLSRGVFMRASVGVAIVAACLLVFGPSLLTLIPSWLFGVVIAGIHVRWKEAGVPSWASVRGRPVTFALVALLVAGMLASNFLNPSRELRFVLVGLCAAPLVLYLAMGKDKVRNRYAHLLARSGEVSFSVYVYHLPIVKLLTVGVAALGSSPQVVAAVLVFLIAAVAYGFCLPLWAVTERNTHHVRIALRRVLGVPESVSPPPRPALTHTT